MNNCKLLTHNRVGDFHYFELEGEKDTYKITVIKVPEGLRAEGWHGDCNEESKYYKVINEDRNTEVGSNTSYCFMKFYLDGTNKEYLPHRLGISEKYNEDFMECVSKFVYPVI